MDNCLPSGGRLGIFSSTTESDIRAPLSASKLVRFRIRVRNVGTGMTSGTAKICDDGSAIAAATIISIANDSKNASVVLSNSIGAASDISFSFKPNDACSL